MATKEARTPASILVEWREAERELATVEAGSPEYDVLAARVHELARAYQEESLRDEKSPAVSIRPR
jgi:hypothetical protein